MGLRPTQDLLWPFQDFSHCTVDRGSLLVCSFKLEMRKLLAAGSHGLSWRRSSLGRGSWGGERLIEYGVRPEALEGLPLLVRKDPPFYSMVVSDDDPSLLFKSIWIGCPSFSCLNQPGNQCLSGMEDAIQVFVVFSPSAFHPYLLWLMMIQFSSVQSLSHVRLFVTPWIAARQASLSTTNSWNLLKLMSIELMMPSSHLILCRPLLLLPPIPPSIRVFSNEN